MFTTLDFLVCSLRSLITYLQGSFIIWIKIYLSLGLPRWLSGKESACNAGDTGLILGPGRSTGGGNSDPLQHSSLGKPMDRGTWWATVHGLQRVGHNLPTEQQQTYL